MERVNGFPAFRIGAKHYCFPAPVAQWIEQQVSTLSAGGSSPSGRADHYAERKTSVISGLNHVFGLFLYNEGLNS